jgi:DNA-binding transcriptional LysR family regulator
MGVSVATVSRAVARLEERLGGRLFNRTSRRLALTDYGHTLAERATKIYAEAEEAEDFARETSSRPRGLVKLAAPLSFGARWVAPLLPEFFRTYPDISVDLHLTDAHADLIGDGFDAALRVAILEDSSHARLVAPVRRFVVASPTYLSRYGRPQHRMTLVRISASPTQTGASATSGALPTKRRGVSDHADRRFTRNKRGGVVPTVLAGLAITELPEFIATQYFPGKQLEPILTDWRLPEGGLYFVTPTARARPAKVSAVADFFIAKLGTAEWSAEAVMGWKQPNHRRK